MENQRFKEIRSTIFLVITAIIWGVAFVAQEIGQDVGTFTFNGIRFILGAVSLFPFVFFMERKVKKPVLKKTLLCGAGGGAILFIAAALQQQGVLMESAGKAGFITGLYTVLVPILGILLGRKTTILTWVGAVFALTGLYFLSMEGGITSISAGDIVLIIGAVFWAVHILWVDRFSNEVSPVIFSQVQFFVCGFLSLAAAVVSPAETISLERIMDGYVPILYCGLLSVGVAYTLQIFGQKNVAPAKAAIIFSLEALFSAVGGALILHSFMKPRGYVGCAFIFAGIILSQLRLGKRKRVVAEND